MTARAIHLGDGAYATTTEGGLLLITANHHEPANASDVVVIEPAGIKTLLAFLETPELGDEVADPRNIAPIKP